LTPGAQVAAAIDILAAVDTGEHPAEEVAADYFRRRRYIGAKDRAQIAGHVYSVLRHRAALDWWSVKHAVEIGSRTRVLAALVLAEGWRPESVAMCCDGERFRPAPLNEAEKRLVSNLARHTLHHPGMSRAVANDLPEWLEPYLDRVFGKGLEQEMVALNASAPTDLRVNLLMAGGKSLALAAQMANRGKLVACDVSAHRLDQATGRLRRGGVGNVERRALTSERDKWVKRHAGGFDRVLVDAPCLGIGAWRRNPGDKWRVTEADLANLIGRQQDILRSAARLVRQGGRLVYATCSLLREENEAQAEAFLAASPEFSVIPAADVWHETIGGAAPGSDRYLRLTPAQHGTDGFFVAIFERQPNPTAS